MKEEFEEKEILKCSSRFHLFNISCAKCYTKHNLSRKIYVGYLHETNLTFTWNVFLWPGNSIQFI